MAEIDEGFDPVPALSEPPSAEEELRLQDALADSPAITVGSAPPVPLGRAPAYDFAAHRMVPGTSGGPLMTRGTETLKTWIEKCIRTRRGENEAVDANFGLDMLAEDLLEEGAPYDPSAVAEYLSAVERGLTVHPRVLGIEDLDLVYDSPDDDAVFLKFRVVTVGDDVDELTFDRLPVGA